MTRGRKPTPLTLRLARGLPPLPGQGDMQPEPGTPPCPRHLDPEAKREWRRLCRELVALNVLSRVDRAALSALCSAWSRYVMAETQVRELGPVIKSPSGFPCLNPYLSITNKAIEQMTKLSSEFGLTPSSRTRIRVAPKPKTDALADFLGESA